MMSGTEMISVAERALKFQNFILRRAWGVYYAIWAFALIFWIFLPYAVNYLYPSDPLRVYFTVYSALGLIAGIASARVFSLARRTLQLRNAASKDKRDGLRLSVSWWLFFSLVAVLTYLFASPHFLTVYMTFLLSIPPIVFRALRYSFRAVPPEGYLATGSFTFSTVASIIISLFPLQQYILPLVWIPTVASWLFSSIYSLYHAPDYMVE